MPISKYLAELLTMTRPAVDAEGDMAPFSVNFMPISSNFKKRSSSNISDWSGRDE